MNSPSLAQRLAERERPAGAPVMRQRWAQLLFLHWAWNPAEIQRTLPPGLTVDVHEGRAWLGLVPFAMEGVRPRGLPAVRGLSHFLELNVRTYVHDAQGRPGVWFYSLDANQWLAVKIARALFHLPYQHATMTAMVDACTQAVDYRSQRQGQATGSRFCYRPAGAAQPAAVGTLEFFLMERYRLFAWNAKGQSLLTGRVHHTAYEIGAAEVSTWDDAVLRLAGFDLEGRMPEHVSVARPVEVGVWPMERVTARAGPRCDRGEEQTEGLGSGVVAPA